MPPIPEKQPVGRFSPQFVEERRMHLERFLRWVIVHPELADKPYKQDWIDFIDYCSMNGINNILALTGQEYIQYNVYKQLGLSDVDIRMWFNGPAFLTWSRGQNEYGNNIGGPLPMSWIYE